MSNITPRISRRALMGGLAATAVVASLSGCGNGGGSNSNNSNQAAVLVIGTGVAASNQFPQNFNRYGGGDTAPGTDLVYETLFRLSSKDGGQLLPVLAEKVEHNAEGTVAKYTLRKGVTWSDGQPFTSKDVLYTLGTIYGVPNPNPPAGEFVWLAKPIETPDDNTVIVTYNSDQRQQEVNLALYYPMVPAHVFQKNGELKFPQDTMSEPVGTGPMKLKHFGSQLVQYEARSDYWGGKVAPSGIDFVPAGQAGNIETQITQGNVDLAEGGAPGVVNGFAKAAPTNAFSYVSDGASRGVVFQMQDPESPMADVNVRKALRVAMDFEAIQKAAGIGYSLPNIAGVDPVMNESLQQAEFNKPIAMDASGAKASLAASSWKVNANGNLEKDGKEHPLSLQLQNDNATDMVTAPVVVAQWKSILGLNVAFDPKPKDVMDGILSDGKFDIVVTGLNYPGTPWTNYTMYDQKIKPRGEKNKNGNWGRWDMGPAAKAKMAILVSTLNTPDTKAKISEGVQGVQAAIAADAPFIPYQGGGNGMMSSSKNWAPLPKLADVDFFPRVGGAANLIKTITVMKKA